MVKVEVSLILACYNEGSTFEKSINQIVNVLKKDVRDWEIIFVEDKSGDCTKKSVGKLVKKIDNSRTIYHSRNQGRGRSVADGILAAKGDICGYLDVDLEVSASYIPLFVKEVKTGADLVVGKRFYEGGIKSLSRLLSSKIYAWSVKVIVNLDIDDTEAGYKFFRRSKIVPLLGKVKSKHWFWDTEICVIANLKNLKIEQVPVLFKRREDKKSTVRLFPDTIDYIKNLIRLKFQIANFKYQTNNKY